MAKKTPPGQLMLLGLFEEPEDAPTPVRFAESPRPASTAGASRISAPIMSRDQQLDEGYQLDGLKADPQAALNASRSADIAMLEAAGRVYAEAQTCPLCDVAYDDDECPLCGQSYTAPEADEQREKPAKKAPVKRGPKAADPQPPVVEPQLPPKGALGRIAGRWHRWERQLALCYGWELLDRPGKTWIDHYDTPPVIDTKGQVIPPSRPPYAGDTEITVRGVRATLTIYPDHFGTKALDHGPFWSWSGYRNFSELVRSVAEAVALVEAYIDEPSDERGPNFGGGLGGELYEDWSDPLHIGGNHRRPDDLRPVAPPLDAEAPMGPPEPEISLGDDPAAPERAFDPARFTEDSQQREALNAVDDEYATGEQIAWAMSEGYAIDNPEGGGGMLLTGAGIVRMEDLCEANLRRRMEERAEEERIATDEAQAELTDLGPDEAVIGGEIVHVPESERREWQTEAWDFGGKVFRGRDEPEPVVIEVRGIRTVVAFAHGIGTHAVDPPGSLYWSDSGFRSFINWRGDPADLDGIRAYIEAFIDSPTNDGNGCGGRLTQWWPWCVRELRTFRRTDNPNEHQRHHGERALAAVIEAGLDPDTVAPWPKKPEPDPTKAKRAPAKKKGRAKKAARKPATKKAEKPVRPPPPPRPADQLAEKALAAGLAPNDYLLGLNGLMVPYDRYDDLLTGDPWGLPSGLFRFPFYWQDDKFGEGNQSSIGLKSPHLRDHPWVKIVAEALDLDLDDPGLYFDKFGRDLRSDGAWRHACDLIRTHTDDLLKTRHFTSDEAIAGAVAFAMHSKGDGKFTPATARRVLLEIGAEEPPIGQPSDLFDEPRHHEERNGKGKVTSSSWPINQKGPGGMTNRGEGGSQRLAWAWVHAIEQGWFTYSRSGYAQWSEQGRALYTGERTTLL